MARLQKGNLVGLKLRSDGKFIVEGFGNNWDAEHDTFESAVECLNSELRELRPETFRDDLIDCAGFE